MRVLANVQIDQNKAIKTFAFEEWKYLGDPLNIIRILNQKGAQEIILTDLLASRSKEINYELIKYIADEVSVPFSYGGGISGATDVKLLASLGVERFLVNSSFYQSPEIVDELVKNLGSSSVSFSLDISGQKFSNQELHFTHTGAKFNSNLGFSEICDRIRTLDVGEIVFRIVDVDGSDGSRTLELYKSFFENFEKEISTIRERQILIGTGVRNVALAEKLVNELEVDGCVVGSMVSFAGAGSGVLISFPKAFSVI
jgi:imidazole glycerol-phosphate synthase subunit HisF